MIALQIALGLLGALLLCFGLWLLWLRKYLEWGNVKTLDIKERVGLKVEFVKTAAQIVGGLFFILTILVAYRNYQISQKNLELAQEKQVTELYVKAIGQLGSDNLPVVLGGLYALERIARDSKKDKGPILEVLTAYVRQNAPWPPEDPAEARKRRPWTKKGLKVASQPKKADFPDRTDHGKAGINEESKPEPDTDIQAVLAVIGRLGPARDGQGDPQPLDLRRTDLQGADLQEAHLERALLWQAHLEGALIFRAHLERALLYGTRLEGAYLYGAHLEGADLRIAHIGGANLWEAHLEGAKLEAAYLEKGFLADAHLEGADLRQAHLEEADLRGAHLEGADFGRVHLEGANLRGALGLTQAEIDQAYCDAETKLPPGLKCSKEQKPSP